MKNNRNNINKKNNNSTVTWVALGLTAVVSVGSLVLQMNQYKKMVPNSTNITTPDNNPGKKQLPSNLSFDPNDNREMIDRIANIYVDALSKGVNNVSIEQWMDFYTVLNLNDIDVRDYARLQNYTKTKDSIMGNFDYVVNTLLDDTITSEPSTIIDIQSLIADKVSAEAVSQLQSNIALFNVSSDKKGEATEINNLVASEFATSNYKQVDAASNLVRMKLLLGMERVTINNSYRVPTADMSKIIFGDSKTCDEIGNGMAHTVYNGEKTIVKQTIESKLGQMNLVNPDNTNVEAIELLTDFEIRMKIEEIINVKNVSYVPNPSLRDAIEANKPKDTAKNPVKSTDKIAKDPKTGKNVIVIPQTEAEKKAQREEIQKQLDKENSAENLRAQGVQEGAQAGWDDGYADGYKGKKYNDNIGNISGDKIYAEAFKDAYKKQYKLGYEDGQKKLEREGNKPTTNNEYDKLYAAGYNDGSRVGYEKGYADGFYNRGYDKSVKVTNESKIYSDAFKIGHTEQYKLAYEKGRIARLSMNEKEWKTLGEKEGATDGYNKGRYDANNGRNYDATCTVTGEKAYTDAYRTAYYQNYNKGYTDTQNKLKLEKEEAQRNAGKEAGAKAGKLKGYEDGYNNRTYNSYISTSGEKAYIDAYIAAYADNYSKSYLEGKKDRESIKYTPSKPSTTTENNSSKPSTTTEKNDKKETIIESVEYDAAPGYHYDDKGRLIDDKTGLEVKISKIIEELKEIKTVAMNVQNVPSVSSDKVHKI